MQTSQYWAIAATETCRYDNEGGGEGRGVKRVEEL